jgi:heme exporter protein C
MTSRVDPSAMAARGLGGFGIFTILLVVGAQVFAFMTSPPDALMGDLQKIMYVHVPSAWIAFLAFFVVFIYSVLYLWRRDPLHDLAGASAAEVGTLFTVLAIAQGSIWGRPTWGVWTWDPRLTTTAVLLLIFAGYLSLRSFTEDEERRARWSAVVGVFGFMNVPIVFMSVRWWRTLHQPQSSIDTMAGSYVWGLLANVAAFTVLMTWMIVARYKVAQIENAKHTKIEEMAINRTAAHV